MSAAKASARSAPALLRITRASALTAFLTALGYLVWFAWDQPLVPRDIDSPPVYEPWQAIGAAVTLAVLAAAVAWFSLGWIALMVIPAVFTLAYSIDAYPDAVFVWPLEAALIGLGALLWVVFVYAANREFYKAKHRETDRRADHSAVHA